MSQLPESSLSSPMLASRSWASIWFAALTKPSVQTYETIAKDGNATLGRALRWFLIASIISSATYIATFFSPSLSGRVYVGSWVPGLLSLFNRSLLGVACAVLLNILLSCASFIVSNAIVHLAVRQLGGTGKFSTFVFTQAAHVVPLNILIALVTSIRATQYLSLIFFVYGIVLFAMAIKAVHNVGWLRVLVAVALNILLTIITALILAVLFGSTRL